MATKGHMPFGGAANVRLPDPNPTAWEDGGPSVLETGPMNPYGSAPGNLTPSHEFSRDVRGTHQSITPPGYYHINQNGGGGTKMAQASSTEIANKLDELLGDDDWVMMSDADIAQELVKRGHISPQEAQNLDVGEIVSGMIKPNEYDIDTPLTNIFGNDDWEMMGRKEFDRNFEGHAGQDVERFKQMGLPHAIRSGYGERELMEALNQVQPRRTPYGPPPPRNALMRGQSAPQGAPMLAPPTNALKPIGSQPQRQNPPVNFLRRR